MAVRLEMLRKYPFIVYSRVPNNLGDGGDNNRGDENFWKTNKRGLGLKGGVEKWMDGK